MAISLNLISNKRYTLPRISLNRTFHEDLGDECEGKEKKEGLLIKNVNRPQTVFIVRFLKNSYSTSKMYALISYLVFPNPNESFLFCVAYR